jgi:preprotein translocase subunit SecY
MLETLRNALKIEDIRKRLFFTFLMLIVIRLGSQLPTPGVDPTFIQEFFAMQTGEAFNFFDAFTGGSFTQMSVFALSITPYITASIIMQLLTIAIPKLEELQKDGEDGKKKIAAMTRYLTVGLALIESAAMAIGFGQQGLLHEFNASSVIIMTVTLTAGSAYLMWIGERITEKGIGNGISIVLVINILSTLPRDLVMLYERFVVNASTIALGILAAVIILLIIVLVFVFVVILQSGERRIAVQYSQRIQGRKTFGGQSTHIPLKVNTSGVIPIIFASSLMQFPIVIAAFIRPGMAEGGGAGATVLNFMNSGMWFNIDNPIYTLGLIVYIFLTIFFAYFYTAITFNPMEIANNMKKNGGFVAGIRPGKPTVEYLQNILNYVIFIGACGLVIVQVIPFFFNGVFQANVTFGGTSLIIIIGVILDTIKQIESKMMVRNYSGFLNNTGGGGNTF